MESVLLQHLVGDDVAKTDAVLTMVLSMDNVTFLNADLKLCRSHVDDNNVKDLAGPYNTCRAALCKLGSLNAQQLYQQMLINGWILNHAEDNSGERANKKLRQDRATMTLATLATEHVNLESVKPAVIAFEHNGKTYYQVPKINSEVVFSKDSICLTLSDGKWVLYSLGFLVAAFDVITRFNVKGGVETFIALVLSKLLQTEAVARCNTNFVDFLVAGSTASEEVCTTADVIQNMKELTDIDDADRAIKTVLDKVAEFTFGPKHPMYRLTHIFRGDLNTMDGSLESNLNKLLFAYVMGNSYMVWKASMGATVLISIRTVSGAIFKCVQNMLQSSSVASTENHWQTLDANTSTVKTMSRADVYSRVHESSAPSINAMCLESPSSNTNFCRLLNKLPSLPTLCHVVSPLPLMNHVGGNSFELFAAGLPLAVTLWNVYYTPGSSHILQHTADNRLHVGDRVWKHEGGKLKWHGKITAFANAGAVDVLDSGGDTHQVSADELHGYVGDSDIPYDWDVERKVSFFGGKQDKIENLRKAYPSKIIQLPPLPLIVCGAAAVQIPPLAAGGINPVQQLRFGNATFEQLANSLVPAMTHVPIPGDGNCQFTSVAVSIAYSLKHQNGYRAIMEGDYGSGINMNARWLRGKVVDLLRNPGQINNERIREVMNMNSDNAGVPLTALQNSGSRFIEGNQQGQHFKDKEAYITYIAGNQNYGDQFTLCLLAQVAKSQLSLYMESGTPSHLILLDTNKFNVAKQGTNCITLVTTGNDATGHYSVLLPAAGGAAVVNPPVEAYGWDDDTIVNELSIRGLRAAATDRRDTLFAHWDVAISSRATLPIYQTAALLRKIEIQTGTTNKKKAELKADLDNVWPWQPPQVEVPQALKAAGAAALKNELLVRGIGGDTLAILQKNFQNPPRVASLLSQLQDAMTVRGFSTTQLGLPTILTKQTLFDVLQRNWPWVKVHPTYTLSYTTERRVGHATSVSFDGTVVARIDGPDVYITKFTKDYTDQSALTSPIPANTAHDTIELIKKGIQSILNAVGEESVTIVIPCTFGTEPNTDVWYTEVKRLQIEYKKHRIVVRAPLALSCMCVKYDPGCHIASKWGVAILDLGFRGRIVIQMTSHSSIAQGFKTWCNQEGSRPLFRTINPGNRLEFSGVPAVPDANKVYVSPSYAEGWVLCYDTGQNKFMIKRKQDTGGQPVLGSVVHHGAVDECMLSDLIAAGPTDLRGETTVRSD